MKKGDYYVSCADFPKKAGEKDDTKPTMDDLQSLLNRAYRYAFSLTHNAAQSEDLVQAACAQILKAKGDWNVGYVFQTIRNKFIDGVRRQKVVREESLDMHIEKHGDSFAGSPEPQPLEVEDMLQSLKDEEREALYLSIVEGYTSKEISRLTGKPIGTILSLIHRSKQKLKDQYQNGPKAN